MRFALQSTDRTLAANGLAQPIVVGEAPYDSLSAGRAIASFDRSAHRPVQEVLEWPNRPGRRCNVSAPYRINRYASTVGSLQP